MFVTRHPPHPPRGQPSWDTTLTVDLPNSNVTLPNSAQKVDANHFFNLLTDARMLGTVEAQLPEHRERQFPPTLTLAMFLGQIMSADGSCQNAVNEAIVARLLAGMNPGSVNTSGYCQARQRLPQEMVSTLARQSGALLGEQTPQAWLWQGRHVKLVDGTTVSMPDTAENQAPFPPTWAARTWRWFSAGAPGGRDCAFQWGGAGCRHRAVPRQGHGGAWFVPRSSRSALSKAM